MTLKEFVVSARESLCGLYPQQEANSMVGLICEEFLDVQAFEFLVNPGLELPLPSQAKAEDAVRRLSGGEPLQYIIGHALFYGRKFSVCPSVLIPRPETELLCRMAIQTLSMKMRERSAYGHNARPLRILDLCTGSGCIAWTMAAELPGAEVVAVDISAEALDVARRQIISDRGAIAPKFIQADVLDYEHLVEQLESISDLPFDAVLSNPPYVLDKEKAMVSANVLEHEPHLALFVPDDEYCRFYIPVAKISAKVLDTDCVGFVEINEAFGPQTASLFVAEGMSEAVVVKDLNGKDRFVRFAKP